MNKKREWRKEALSFSERSYKTYNFRLFTKEVGIHWKRTRCGVMYRNDMDIGRCK